MLHDNNKWDQLCVLRLHRGLFQDTNTQRTTTNTKNLYKKNTASKIDATENDGRPKL